MGKSKKKKQTRPAKPRAHAQSQVQTEEEENIDVAVRIWACLFIFSGVCIAVTILTVLTWCFGDKLAFLDSENLLAENGFLVIGAAILLLNVVSEVVRQLWRVRLVAPLVVAFALTVCTHIASYFVTAPANTASISRTLLMANSFCLFGFLGIIIIFLCWAVYECYFSQNARKREESKTLDETAIHD